jgi:hypothetical protein
MQPDETARHGMHTTKPTVPQTAPIPVVTSHDTFELPNFATHSPEDKQRDRRSRSARLERTGPKQVFYYRSSPLCDCCQVVVRVFFEVGFDGEGVAALVPGRIVVPRSGSGLSEEPAFGV